MTDVLLERDSEAQSWERRTPCDNKGQDPSVAVASQETAKLQANQTHQRRRKRKTPPLQISDMTRDMGADCERLASKSVRQ